MFLRSRSCDSGVAFRTPVSGNSDSLAPRASRSSTLRHGIVLAVASPRTTYPRDALAAVTVRVQNRSGHTVQLTDDSCSIQNPQVEILNHSGHIVYPPALHLSFGPPCRLPGIHPLGVAHTLVKREYVIARSSWLRARASVQSKGRWFEVASSPTRRSLRSRTVAPERRLDSTVNPTQVTVVPPTGATGRIVYQSQVRCSDGSEASNLSWTLAPHGRIRAGCDHVLE